MSIATRRYTRVSTPLLLSILLCFHARARAGDSSSAANRADDADWVSGGGTRAAPAYVDRLITGLAPLPIDSDEGSGGPAAGRPRSLTVESSLTQLSPSSRGSVAQGVIGEQQTTEAGIAVSGRYGTGSYGTVGVDGTLRYGTFTAGFGSTSIAGTDSNNRPVVGGTLRLSDTGMPIGHGWAVDSAVGVIEPASILLAHAQSRFYLPSQPLLGAQVIVGEQSRDGRADIGNGTSFNFAVGEPGLPGGLRVAQFRGLGGLEVTGGAEFRPAPGFAIGIQAIDARHVRDPYGVVFGNLVGFGRLDGQSVLVAASAGGTDWRVQLNLQHSNTHQVGSLPTSPAILPVNAFPGLGVANVGSGSATGAWLDALFDRGRWSQSAGLFYLDPRLAWGATPMINDSYGGYYRLNVSGTRWRWFAGVDVSRSVSGAGLDSEYLDVGVRRQFNGIAVGGEAALRIIGAGRSVVIVGNDAGTVGAKQVTGYVEMQSRLGQTRFEAGYSFDREEKLAHVSATQTWTLPSWLPGTSRLSTQVFYDDQRDRILSAPGGTIRANGIGVAVTAGGDVLSRISIDASVVYGGTSNGAAGVTATGANLGALTSFAGFSSNYNQRGENFSATLAANARLSSHWTVNGSFTDAETYAVQASNIFGLAAGAPGQTDATTLRNYFRLISASLAVRYSFAAGRASAPVGNRTFAGSGTGSIAGHIFLDANGNGRRDPGDGGVRNAVVVLDDRSAVRTDAAGYYRFDDVGEGAHRITVQTDALPLPWHYARTGEGKVDASAEGFSDHVEVSVRRTTILDVQATR